MKFAKLKTIGKFFLKTTMGFLLFSLLVVSLLKWVDPPINSFMIRDKLEALKKKEKQSFITTGQISKTYLHPCRLP